MRLAVVNSRAVSGGRQSGAISKALARSGEYVTIPVQRRVTPQPGGGAVVEISLDLQSAPIPDRRYSADASAALRTPDDVQLVLGQARIVGPLLRSMVVIKLSFDAVRGFLTTCVPFMPPLRAFVTDNVVNKPATLQFGGEEPNQSVVMAANMVAAAYVGREACLDFYHTSPFALRALGNDGTQLAVDPVVRVDLTTGALLSMIEQLEALQGELPEPVRQEGQK